MKSYSIRMLLLALIVCSAVVARSQQQLAGVPHVVRFSGTLNNVDGTPRTGTLGISFSIYADDKTTVPLWQEVQNVTLDSTGHYTVLLGAASAQGLPDTLFADNTARWLGIRVESEREQPRVLLAAVPYALKAADAETLGGKPLSAFVLNETSASKATGSGTGSSATSSSAPNLQPMSINTSGSTGTQNQVAKWTDNAGTLGNSLLTDTGSAVGLNNTTPTTPLDVSGTIRAVLSPSAPFGTYLMPTGGAANSFRFGFGNNLYFDGTNWRTKGDGANNAGSGILTDIGTGALSIYTLPSTGATDQVYSDSAFNAFEKVRVSQTGNVGVNNSSPTTTLDVGGTIRAVLGAGAPFGTYLMPTGGAANSFRFGFGNNLYFDGTNWRTKGDGANNAGSGIITDIGTGALSIYTLPSTGATDQVISNSAFNAFEKMRVAPNGNVGIGTSAPAQKLDVAGNINSGGNVTATGNMTATGSMTAASFSGSGAALTSLAAANLTGTLPSAALSGTYSSAVTFSNVGNSFSGSGAGLTSVNAASLGGVSSSVLNERVITYLGGCDSCSVLTPSDNQNMIYQNLLGATLTFQSVTCYSDAGTPSIDIQRDNGTQANLTGTSIGCSTTGNTVSSFNVTALNNNEKLNFLMTTPGTVTHRVTVIIKATL